MAFLRDPHVSGDQSASDIERAARTGLTAIGLIALLLIAAIIAATCGVYDHLRPRQPVKRIFYELPPEHVRVVMVKQ